MNSMIHIGNEANKYKDSASEAAKAIDVIFGSAREHFMDQNTVIEALRTLSQISEIKNITITNSTFNNSLPETPGVDDIAGKGDANDSDNNIAYDNEDDADEE